ncbi:MAG: DUF3575 domain-containing protein, partial [Bacteroidales bacterium]|nr:DUF3575 domain-containing protein [Bacteroidales bacterium]
HLDRILATSRANTTAQYIKNKYLVNQEIIKIDNIYINTGASRAIWPDLRNARIVVDYTRVSKDVPLLQTTQMANKVQAMVAKAETKSAQPQIKTLLVKAEGKQKASKDFRIALKTNALYDILLTPNVGMEIPVYKNWSVAANWMYAWWKADPNSWYHRIYGGDIEVRRYIRQWPWSKANGTGKANENGKASCTPLAGWHIGVYAQMLTYDFEWGGTGNLGDKWSYAAGVAAGYSKNIAPRLNLDFTLGVGYLTGEYMEYKPIDNCYVWQATKQRHWIGPTKAEVSLVWLLGKW